MDMKMGMGMEIVMEMEWYCGITNERLLETRAKDRAINLEMTCNCDNFWKL